MAGWTTRSLNACALTTAHLIEEWVSDLLNEMEKQNVKFAPRLSHGVRTDDDETMTLKRGYVRRLIGLMDQQQKELRRLAKRPKPSAQRRSPRGFSP
jgi:hypothetical protein